MKLYLASNALRVVNEIKSLLPFDPVGKTVAYIGTASKDKEWVQENIEKIEAAGFVVKAIDLALLSSNDLADAFQACDIIWVGGGNTFYLLQEVRRSGFDKLVTKKLLQGVPYVGTSAGSIIMGPNIEMVKFGDDPLEASYLKSYQGLNLFPLVPIVHIDLPHLKNLNQRILNFGLENDIPFLSLHENQFIYVAGEHWRIVGSTDSSVQELVN